MKDSFLKKSSHSKKWIVKWVIIKYEDIERPHNGYNII